MKELDTCNSLGIKVRLWVSKHGHPWVRVFVDITLDP